MKKSQNTIDTTAWISIGTLAALFFFTIVKYDKLHIVLTGGFLAVQVLLTVYRFMPRLFHFLFPITAIVFMLGSKYVFNLYETIEWYDKFVHILATFVITLLLGYLSQRTSLKAVRSQSAVFVPVIASLGIVVGVMWEVVEWVFEFIVPVAMNAGTNDLITDLIVDSLGAIGAAVVCVYLPKRVN
jgi:hypothetical protein